MTGDRTRVQRLFLGGPLHGRRLPVDESSQDYVALKPPSLVYLAEPMDPFLTDNQVMYRLRRPPGGRDRVFVALDYGYDTPEWLAFDTEAWATSVLEGCTHLEHLGEWLWRAKMPDFKLKRQWRYLLGDGRGEKYVSCLVADELAHEAAEYVREELRRELEYHLMPTCVAPDCTDKAPVVFIAAERGRLAGRAWKPGDEIRLCPKHGRDVYLAQGVYGVDQLAEWLRPDAAPGRDDLYCAAAAARYGEDTIRRVLRLGRKVDHG